MTGSGTEAERAAASSERGRTEEEIALHRHALELEPGNLDHLRALAELMQNHEDKDEALVVWRALLEVEPCSPVRELAARELHARKRYREQVELLAQDIEGCEELPSLLNNLAWALATVPDDEVRDGQAALATIERAMEMQGPMGQGPAYLDTLAAALAELGRFQRAIQVQERAVRNLRKRRVPAEVIAQFEDRLAGYRKGLAVRDS